MTEQSEESGDLGSWVFIRSTVEHPGGTDEEWTAVPRAEWEAMTPRQQSDAQAEIAVNHQNNVAPCGASPVDDLEEIPDYVLANPAGVKW